MRKLSKAKRIEQTIWHEVGHVIMSLHHGIVPIMTIVGHNGWHGYTQFRQQDGERIDKRHKDVLLAGYAWVRLFTDSEQDGFFSNDVQGEETDWAKLGCPDRAKIERMMTRYYGRLDYTDVSWGLHGTLWEYGYMPEQALRKFYHDVFLLQSVANLRP